MRQLLKCLLLKGEKMKKKFKIIALSLLMAVVCMPLSKVKALLRETSYYDAISWVYTYQAPYTNSYNCLGWATGSMTFEWPIIWGEGATQTQVVNYLKAKGYYVGTAPAVLTTSTRILAYGPSSNKITHFAKVSNKNVTAKWGGLERFSHGQHADPYYSTSDYGMARITFN